MTFFNGISTIIISLVIGLVLSVIFMLLVQLLSRKAPITYIVVGSGCGIIIIMALFVLSFPSSYLGLRIVFAIILVLLLASIYFGWKN